jgi:hypothetical protein
VLICSQNLHLWVWLNKQYIKQEVKEIDYLVGDDSIVVVWLLCEDLFDVCVEELLFLSPLWGRIVELCYNDEYWSRVAVVV